MIMTVNDIYFMSLRTDIFYNNIYSSLVIVLLHMRLLEQRTTIMDS